MSESLDGVLLDLLSVDRTSVEERMLRVDPFERSTERSSFRDEPSELNLRERGGGGLEVRMEQGKERSRSCELDADLEFDGSSHGSKLSNAGSNVVGDLLLAEKET